MLKLLLRVKELEKICDGESLQSEWGHSMTALKSPVVDIEAPVPAPGPSPGACCDPNEVKL